MPEFNPNNEVTKKKYEEILIHAQNLDSKTVRAAWNSISMFEKSTGYQDFKTLDKQQAQNFKARLAKQTNAEGEVISLATMRTHLKNVRDFFKWLAIHPGHFKKINGDAVEYFRLSDKRNRAAHASKEKIPPTLEELKKALSAMPCSTDIEKRDRAIFAFTIITGARVSSIISIKRQDINLDRKTVWQNPKHVDTKRGKGIMTRFVTAIMPMAETIVIEWVKYIDDVLGFGPSDPIFPKVKVETNAKSMSFEAIGLSKEHWASSQPVRDIFKSAFKAAGLPYYHPHLFRNTICKWGLGALGHKEYKALSQNIGHDHVMTTYNSYANLTQGEQIEIIANIDGNNTDLQSVSTDAILAEFARRTTK